MTLANKKSIKKNKIKYFQKFWNFFLGESQSPDEAAEKARIVNQILELQNTLEDLSQRVDSVKEENLKLKSENDVLGKYIENLMLSSSVFQHTGGKSKNK